MLINEKIVSVLRKKNLTQKNLSEYIGVSSSTLNNWLKKNSDIPAQYIIPISEFLKENPLFLLDGQETKKSVPGLTEDEQKVLNYYSRLKEEQKDYIKGEMARLNMANRQDAEFAEEQAT